MYVYLYIIYIYVCVYIITLYAVIFEDVRKYK